ncbi:MAG: PIN domain-containing protein [Thermoplasmata archaeon]|nr:MAG: PIN domain-containing protein [Thermoplasmata archaeon]
MKSLKRSSGKSLKIIVDTNIIFSAILFPEGNENRLFTLADEGKLEIIICDYVLDETIAVLKRKDIDPNLMLDFLDTFRNIQIIDISEPEDEEILRAVKVVTDEKDRPVFIFARRMIYDDENVYLVSGDKDLRTGMVKKDLKGRSITTGELLKKIGN